MSSNTDEDEYCGVQPRVWQTFSNKEQGNLQIGTKLKQMHHIHFNITVT